MVSDVEFLFICLWAIRMSFLEKCLYHVLCPFSNWIVRLPGVESYEFFIYFGDQALV